VAPFPQVRVYRYNIFKRIVFDDLTFYPVGKFLEGYEFYEMNEKVGFLINQEKYHTYSL